MRKKFLINLLIIIGFLSIAVIVFLLWRSGVKSSSASYKFLRLNPSLFSAADFFVEYEDPSSEICGHRMLGGITTHHQQASPMIGQFFRCLQTSTEPETIILIGPNHYHAGSRGILLANQAWDTPFGIVEPKEEFTEKLAQSDLVEINNEAVSQDHAISLLLPYISFYFPEAEVVPLLINYNVDEKQADNFQKFLQRAMADGAVVIGSIDFSHYLTAAEAGKMDFETQTIIREYRLTDVYDNGDEHYDSAPGLYIILSLMKQKNAQAEIIGHSDTSEFGGSSNYVTSYFNWAFF